MTAYATRSDLYNYGLPRGNLTSPARLVASALASTDKIELDDHGFATNDQVVFRAAEGGTLPSPLVAGTTYFAIYVSDTVFQVAATSSGSAINLTTDGTNVVVGAPLPISQVLEFYSRFVDAFLPAHQAPLSSPYPVVVVAIVAELAAKKLMSLAGHTSVAVDAAEAAAETQLKRWAQGIPLRDAAATASANLAVTRTGTTVDERGWGSGTLP